MTPEAMRVAIAEACGWTEVYRNEVFGRDVTGLPPGYTGKAGGTIRRVVIPNYPGDLNAMQEAEKALKGGLLEGSPMYNYTRELHKLCLGMGHLATAAQRAEAFLRTLNRWTD